MSQGRLRVLIGVGLLVAAAVASEPAQAGTFQLRSCMAAKAENYDSGAFAGTRSSGRMVVKRGCNPFGRGERGLVTGNKVSRRRLRRNEHATVVLWTPPGTRIYRFDWSGKLRRGDCGFTAELYAVRPGQRPAYIKRARAGRSCPKPTTATASYAPPRRYDVGAATALVQRVICRSRQGCSASQLTMVTTRYAQAYVADFTRPFLRVLGGGLASRRWVRGSQNVRFAMADNLGIRDARLFVEGRQFARAAPPCNFSHRIPCPSGPGTLAIDTSRAGDGPHRLSLLVEDAAGNLTPSSLTAFIDNTPPGRIDPEVLGGAGWRRSNDFSAGWRAALERFAPISAALTRLCSTTGAGCRRGHYAGYGISQLRNLRVPGPGEWSLSVWRQDAAGNASEALASVPVRLRYDPDPPQLAFEHQSVTDPTRVSVRVNERLSGLAGGGVELRRLDTSTWHSLATRIEGTTLVSRIDDSRLPAGVYQLRSLARDRAGNESSTASRIDGSPMVLRLPIRFEALMSAGIVRVRTVRRKVRRNGKRRVVRRRVRRLVPSARVRFGRRVRVSGRLTNFDGQPFGGATVYVYSRSLGTSEGLAGVVTTNGHGRFSYVARGTSSRVLRFVYLGTTLALPAQREAILRVPATSTLRASRRRASNGQTVTFRGRVRTRPLPAAGKLVEIQAHFRGRWRTFSTVHSDRKGRWRFRYRFGGTVGKVRYRFRALLPSEAGYPFETGRSRKVTVVVRGP